MIDNLQRYAFAEFGMEEDADGDWVKLADVGAALRGVAVKKLTAHDLEAGKPYYIKNNGLCEYIGFDHYLGQTTCKFRRIELAVNHRDFYYESLARVPVRVFLSKGDCDASN